MDQMLDSKLLRLLILTYGMLDERD
jgi:hypothetical protein